MAEKNGLRFTGTAPSEARGVRSGQLEPEVMRLMRLCLASPTGYSDRRSYSDRRDYSGRLLRQAWLFRQAWILRQAGKLEKATEGEKKVPTGKWEADARICERNEEELKKKDSRREIWKEEGRFLMRVRGKTRDKKEEENEKKKNRTNYTRNNERLLSRLQFSRRTLENNIREKRSL